MNDLRLAAAKQKRRKAAGVLFKCMISVSSPIGLIR
jgi:hypothetical protein